VDAGTDAGSGGTDAGTDAGGGDVDAGADAGSSGCTSGAADEDEDGVGDDCDLCPVDRDAPQANGDGDGIGDACDDDLAGGGDTIGEFLPFNATYSGFVGNTPSFDTSVGQLHTTQETSAQEIFTDHDVASDNYVLSANLRITNGVGNAGILSRVYVETGETVANASGWYCALRVDDQGRGHTRLYSLEQGVATDFMGDEITGYANGQTWRVTMTVNGNSIRCDFSGVEDRFVSRNSGKHSGQAIGVRASDVSAQWDYLVLYQYD
jgi:hypothetical protein